MTGDTEELHLEEMELLNTETITRKRPPKTQAQLETIKIARQARSDKCRIIREQRDKIKAERLKDLLLEAEDKLEQEILEQALKIKRRHLLHINKMQELNKYDNITPSHDEVKKYYKDAPQTIIEKTVFVEQKKSRYDFI